MTKFLGNILDAICDQTPETLIGSVIISLTLALIGAGIYSLRREKGTERGLMTLVGLMLVVSVVSMAIGGGQMRSDRDGSSIPTRQASSFGRQILDAADRNRDGRLTPDEGGHLAMIADRARKGYADAFDLDHVRSFQPPPATGLAWHPGGDRIPARCDSPTPLDACYPQSGGLTGHEPKPRDLAWMSPPPRRSPPG